MARSRAETSHVAEVQVVVGRVRQRLLRGDDGGDAQYPSEIIG